MKPRTLLTMVVGIQLVAMLGSLTVSAQQGQTVLTNQDVIRMVKNGLPESVIVASIQNNPTNFDTSVDGLIALHKAGASQKIMDAVVASAANRQQQAISTAGPGAGAAPGALQPTAPQPTAGTAQGPTILDAGSRGLPSSTQGPTILGTGSVGGGSTPTPGVAPATPVLGGPSVELLGTTLATGASQTAQTLAAERTQLAETKNKPTSMTSLASDSMLTQALQAGMSTATTEVMMHSTSMGANNTLTQASAIFSGMLARHKPSVTYVWAVPNTVSANSLSNSKPQFVLDFSKVPGIHADDFEPAIVKLTPSQNAWRLVGATQGKEDARSTSVADWQIYSNFLEDRVRVTSRKLGPGNFEITPTAPLLPGEYAIVLRPVSRDKKFSGGDVARNQGDGMMFNSAWSFQIAPGAKP